MTKKRARGAKGRKAEFAHARSDTTTSRAGEKSSNLSQ